MISLLHGTARPGRWQEICSQWLYNCDQPSEVEYILVYEPGNFPSGMRPSPGSTGFSNATVIANNCRPCVVDAYNIAADAAKGDLLFYIADDFYSQPHWDSNIYAKFPRSRQHDFAVLWVNTGEGADRINHPLWTRAYYNSKGYYLWPEYQDLFSDTEFDEIARRDGVVVDMRQDLFFNHQQAGTAMAKYPHDEVNLRMLSHWSPQENLYNRRLASGFPTNMKNLKPLGEQPFNVFIPKMRRNEPCSI